MNKHLIQIAYEYAKENFNKTPFSFRELFDALSKQNGDIKSDASDLYIELLQDIRFISLGKQKWALRENFTLAEINKISSSMFGLEEYHEEDADKYMSDIEKKEQISKKENIEDLSDFIDENSEDGDNSSSSGGSDDLDENDDISKDDYDSPTDDEDDDDLIDTSEDEENIEESDDEL